MPLTGLLRDRSVPPTYWGGIKEMAKKLKISRKQMRKPDEFLTWTEQVWDWAEKHTWQAAAVVAGLVVLFLGVQGIGMLIRSSGQAPRADLARAINTFNAPVLPPDKINGPNAPAEAYTSSKEKFERAAAGLSDIARNYPDKPVGQMATLYLARSQEELGDYDAAAGNYQKFAAGKMAQQEPVLKYSALMGLGQSSFAAGKFQQALDYYTQIQDSDSVSTLKPAAMIAIARCRFNLDHPDQAKTDLSEVRKQFPDAWMAQPSEFLASYWQENKDHPEVVLPKMEPGQSSSTQPENNLLMQLSGGTQGK